MLVYCSIIYENMFELEGPQSIILCSLIPHIPETFLHERTSERVVWKSKESCSSTHAFNMYGDVIYSCETALFSFFQGIVVFSFF